MDLGALGKAVKLMVCLMDLPKCFIIIWGGFVGFRCVERSSKNYDAFDGSLKFFDNYWGRSPDGWL